MGHSLGNLSTKVQSRTGQSRETGKISLIRCTLRLKVFVVQNTYNNEHGDYIIY